MRGGGAINLKGGRVLGGQNLQARVVFDGAGEIDQLSVYASDQGGVSKARADRLRDVDRPAAGGNGLNAAIGQGDVDTTHRGAFIIARPARLRAVWVGSFINRLC